jgi:hypothetical protein
MPYQIGEVTLTWNRETHRMMTARYLQIIAGITKDSTPEELQNTNLEYYEWMFDLDGLQVTLDGKPVNKVKFANDFPKYIYMIGKRLETEVAPFELKRDDPDAAPAPEATKPVNP